MRRSEAPPPGWYPDPTGGSGLWWWDGLDWTGHRRPPPASLDDHAHPLDAAGTRPAAGERGAIASAHQLRNRASAGDEQRRARREEQMLAESIAQARRVAQSEVERAVQDATKHLTATRDRWMPRLDQYRTRLRRWLRVAVVAVFVLVIVSAWMNATMSTGLLEWLGERVDAATATIEPPLGAVPVDRTQAPVASV